MLYIIGKSAKKLAAESDKICEIIACTTSVLVLDKRTGQTDEGVYFEILHFNIDPAFLSSGTTKFLQPLDVPFFQDYKYLVKKKKKKKIVEYSKTHWSICGDIEFTMRVDWLVGCRLKAIVRLWDLGL